MSLGYERNAGMAVAYSKEGGAHNIDQYRPFIMVLGFAT